MSSIIYPSAIASATASFDATVAAKAVVAIVVSLVPADCVVAVTALDSDPPLIVGLVSVLLLRVWVAPIPASVSLLAGSVSVMLPLNDACAGACSRA